MAKPRKRVLARLVVQQAGEYSALCRRLHGADARRTDALPELGILAPARDRAKIDAMIQGAREAREKLTPTSQFD